jgi:hypothetical protein
MEFLHAIERGEITLTPERCPQDVYAGNVAYKASNGWTVVVFNDCNHWDYVSEIVLSDGSRIDPWVYADGESLLLSSPDRSDDLDPRWRPVRKYRPRPAHQWSIYHIPGYLNWRCDRCNAWLPNNEGGHDEQSNQMLCKGCGGVHPEPDWENNLRSVDPKLEAMIQKDINDARQEVIDDEAQLAAEQE